MARRNPPTTETLLGWVCLGLGVGLAVGYILGLRWRTLDRGQFRPPWGRRPESEPARRASALARATLAALNQDQSLVGLDLSTVGVGRGIVELHGWVSSRALRARAARLAQAVPGVESLVNCILVHGEDDERPPRLEITDQPA